MTSMSIQNQLFSIILRQLYVLDDAFRYLLRGINTLFETFRFQMLRFSGSISWRLGIRAIIRKQSTTNAAAIKTDKIEDTKNVQGKIPIAETFKDTSGRFFI